MSKTRYFFTDTETSSLKGRICDFALVELDEELNVIGTIEALIDPQEPMAPAAQAVHGISDAMVANEPTMKEWVEINGNPFAGGPCRLFAHNAKFDSAKWKDTGLLHDDVKFSCTLRMARNQWPDLDPERENHQLGTLAVMLGLETGTAHRAMGDCITGVSLLRHLARTTGVSNIQELFELGTRPLSLESAMTFGKHRGMKLKDLPISYVQWLTGQSDMDPELVEALKPRLNRR